MSDVRTSLEVYRGMREELEAAVLPLATSVDGRGFHFQTSLHGLEFEPGGYVTLDARRLHSARADPVARPHHTWTATGPGMPGQIRIRVGQGEGVVLDGDGRPFHDGSVRRATSDDVKQLDRPDQARPGAAGGRRAGAGAGRALRTRRGRIWPPHVSVWPVRLGQDLCARRAARAPDDGDQRARGRTRSQLGLCAPGRAARRRAARARGALPGCRRHGWRAHGDDGPGRRAGALPRPELSLAGGRVAAGPAGRPRGVLPAARAGGGRKPAQRRGHRAL